MIRLLFLLLIYAHAQVTYDEWELNSPDPICAAMQPYLMDPANGETFTARIVRGYAGVNLTAMAEGFVVYRHQFIADQSGPVNCWLDYSVDITYPGDTNGEPTEVPIDFDVATLINSNETTRVFLLGAVAYKFDELSQDYLFSKQATPLLYISEPNNDPYIASFDFLYYYDTDLFDLITETYELDVDYEGDTILVSEPDYFKIKTWVDFMSLKWLKDLITSSKNTETIKSNVKQGARLK